jgi:hypothetical protein
VAPPSLATLRSVSLCSEPCYVHCSSTCMHALQERSLPRQAALATLEKGGGFACEAVGGRTRRLRTTQSTQMCENLSRVAIENRYPGNTGGDYVLCDGNIPNSHCVDGRKTNSSASRFANGLGCFELVREPQWRDRPEQYPWTQSETTHPPPDRSSPHYSTRSHRCHKHNRR